MNKLNEYDEDEWYTLMHPLRPEVSREEFHQMWFEFQEAKRKHSLN